MSSIEIIGGIKAENVAVKSEKDSYEDDGNVVEICAEDIQNDIKKEPKENEEGDGESDIIDWRIKREGDHIKTKVDKQVRQEGKKETKPSHIADLEEKLIINYNDDDLPNKRGQYPRPESKSNKNNDGNENTVKVKPSKRRKRGIRDPLFKLTIKKSEYSLLEDVRKYRCNYCQTLVTSRKDVYKHIRQLHRHADGFDNREDKLKQLVDKVKTYYFAWYEYKFEGEDGYRCSHCKELIKGRKSTIVQHIIENHRKHKEKIYFQCPHCPYRTLSKLEDHIISVHTDVKDIQYFRCDKCDFKAKLKAGIRRHILSMHLNMLYKCPQCPKIFKIMDLLKAHEKRIHNADSVGRLKCHHCAFECKSKPALRQHIETHHTKVEDLETLQCTHCQFKTKHKHRLQAHISVNHRRVLQCHICSYQCTVKTLLNLHLVGHKTEKNEKDLKYRCDKCDYRTHRMYSFQVHKLNHLKPDEIQYFYCYHCEFKAKRKDNLKTHVLRHFKQDDVLLQCYRCDFTTKKRLILVRHLNGHSRKLNKVEKKVSNVTTVKQDALVDYEDELLKEAAREKKEQAEDSTVTEKQLEEMKTKSESGTVLPIRRSQRRKRKSKT